MWMERFGTMLKLIKQIYNYLTCEHKGNLQITPLIGRFKCKECGKIIFDR